MEAVLNDDLGKRAVSCSIVRIAGFYAARCEVLCWCDGVEMLLRFSNPSVVNEYPGRPYLVEPELAPRIQRTAPSGFCQNFSRTRETRHGDRQTLYHKTARRSRLLR
jgi:hypothetical protein